VAREYRKNANGEGSVFQRKNGYWVASTLLQLVLFLPLRYS
jgi:hypothetical protein